LADNLDQKEPSSERNSPLKGSRDLEVVAGVAKAIHWGALACWLYVAAVAIVAPQDLPLRFEETLPIRTDTLGIGAFAISVCMMVVTAMMASFRPQVRWSIGAVWAIARSVALHATLGWAYISANSISHRWTLHRRLTHLAPWPTEGTFGVACLLVAILSTSVYFGLKPRVVPGP
jgi:hypothetical protein